MDEEYQSIDESSGVMPMGPGMPPPPKVDAALSPSGEQVPAAQVAPQEFFSRSAGSSDIDSMQFKRLLRVFYRHWLLIFFLGILLGGLMFTYNVILNKKWVPAWIRIGPKVQYASSITIKQINKFEDIQVKFTGMSIQPIQMDMSNLGSIMGRPKFREFYIEEMRNIRDNPEVTPLVREKLTAYIENPKLRVLMATQIAGGIYGGQTTVTNKGTVKEILPPLGDAIVPALNRFGKIMRSEGLELALAKLNKSQKQNSNALANAYMKLNQINSRIQKLLPDEPEKTNDSGERAELNKRRTQLILNIRREENELAKTRHRVGYEKLKRYFGIVTPADINKVLIAGNPLRQEWESLSSQLEDLSLTLTENHPNIIHLQQEIIRIVRRIKDKGGTTQGGKLPPLPTPEQEKDLQAVMQNERRLETLRLDLSFIESQLKRLQKLKTDEEDEDEYVETPEMLELKVKLANQQAEISRLRQVQQTYTNQIGDLEVSKSYLDKEKEFEAVGRATPSIYQEPRWFSNTMIAAIFGLVIGYVLAWIAESSDTYLHTPSDVYYHLRLNYLGVVPRWSDKEQTLIPAERPDSHIGEVYSHLCLNIRYGRSGTPEKRLLIASATQAEGKTTTAANIAIRYAVEGNKVLLVDADLRRPRLHKLLQINGGQSGHMLGLADYLAGERGLEEICYPTNVSGLSIAPAGSRVRNPAKLLTSPKLGEFLNETDEAFDILVVDCPAVLPVVDATIIAPHMLSVLLVVAADEVSIGAVRMAMYRLQHVGAPLVGALLNKVSERSTSYTYYGYRYRQGYYYSPYSKTYGDTDEEEDALE